MPSKDFLYFPNLNGLRFIAAIMVVVHHLEQFLFLFGFQNSWENKIIHSIGGLGVKLFFVLSGFLITYLLLTEEKNTNKISIKQFYLRRIFRIWPLYYFVVLLSFFVLQNINLFIIPGWSNSFSDEYWFIFYLFMLFLPNVALFNFGVAVPYASQSWSVGVEEQFYLIWPILLKFFKKRLIVILSVILFLWILKYGGFRFIKQYIFWNNVLEQFKLFINSFSIDSMAIGALFAYSSFKNYSFIKRINNIYSFYICTLSLTILIVYSITIKFFDVYALLFAVIILNLATNNKLKKVLENKVLNYLGKISFGLYMYHVISIVVCIKIFSFFGIIEFHFLLLISSILLTILISGFSYRFLEERFIILKSKYSSIISGDNAKVL